MLSVRPWMSARGESDRVIVLPERALTAMALAAVRMEVLKYALAMAQETLGDLGAPATLESVSLYVATPHDRLLGRC